MNPLLQTLLISVVFVSQIVVLSFVAPRNFTRFYKELFDRYPETEYPRLYPVPRAETERSLRCYEMIRMATGLIGLAALMYGIADAAEPTQLARIMGWVAFYQVFAILLGLPWRYPKQNDVPPPARRSVGLRRWSVTDFVSPALVLLGFGSMLSVYVAVAYLHVYGGSNVALSELEDVRFFMTRVTSLVVASVLLAWMTYRIVRPVSPVRKERMNDIWLPVRNDPYLSDSDRLRQRRQFLRWQFVGVTVIGLLLWCYLFWAARILVFNPVWFRLVVSIGWQALFLLAPIYEFRRIRSHDFSVYRAA